MGKVRERRIQANYLNIGKETDTYVLMGAGFTDMDEKPSAKTSSKKYVNDKSDTKSVIGYDWSTDIVADQIVSEEAIAFIINIGEKQLTGEDAEAEYAIVDLDKKVTGEGGAETTFHARMIKVAIEISEFPNGDGELTLSGSLLGIGDMTEGVFDTATKKFTVGTSAPKA